MQRNEFIFPKDIYSKYLKTIREIYFTQREIDIIACILQVRGTSKVASFLSISPNTALIHIRNIMLKIGCNSREGIIDFVEKSSKIYLLETYYIKLILEEEFKKALKKISALKKDNPSNLLICWKNQALKTSLIQNLEEHLKCAGIYVNIREKNANFKIDSLKKSGHIFLILLEKHSFQSSSPEFSGFKLIDITTQNNYYLSTISILQCLFIDLDLQDAFHDFLQYYNGLFISSEEKHLTSYKGKRLRKEEKQYFYNSNKLLNNKKLFFILLMILLFFILLTTVHFFKQQKETCSTQVNNGTLKHFIRSDLAVPTETFSLHRPEEIIQIDKKLKGHGIRAVALIGPGGAGKTTLARQYAHQENAHVIWELNAETNENLKCSFEGLARALVTVEEDQKILREIQETKDPVEKEEKLIQFVKERLKAHSNWLLIYDNMIEFADIQKYFPQDFVVWGEGKIILTTRDANVQNCNSLNGSIKIGELNANQQLTLFTKIRTNGEISFSTAKEIEEAKKFVAKIPPYPLDLAVAAYYLKAVNIPYSVYLENLVQNRKGTTNIQEKLLKGAGGYAKTRYEILTMSLQHLINAHKDFKDLLVFVSLLDSQNFPRSLLNAYTDKLSVDEFIYNIKKYSLITNESSLPSSGQTISLHRDTQTITLEYLLSLMNKEEQSQMFQGILKALEKYIDEIIATEDLFKLQSFVTHCEAFLTHENLLNTPTIKAMRADLGSIYYFLGYYKEGKKLLEASIIAFDKYNYRERLLKSLMYLGKIYVETDEKNNIKKIIEKINRIYENHFSEQDVIPAKILTSLGDMHDSLGNYQKAKDLLYKSVTLHKKDLKNHLDLALTLALLGNVCRKMGNYSDAKTFLEESLIVYKNANAEGHFRVGWILIHLGNIYLAFGEYEKANQLIEKGVEIYKKYSSEDHPDVAWATGYLGNSYIEAGDYQKAKNLLQKTLIIYQRNFEEGHGGLLRTKMYLANAYIKLKNYKEAKIILTQVLKKYEDIESSDPVEIAAATQALAEVYFLDDQLEDSENLIKRALKLFSQHKHPNISRSLESLSELYLKKSILSMDINNPQKAKIYKAQAISFLNQALKLVKEHFPVGSPYIKRIQLKLRGIK